MLIYHTFIEANLNYCPLFRMNRNKTDMKHIENVQNRALRMVFNDYSSSYQGLLKRAKTGSLEIRWKRQLITKVVTCLNLLSLHAKCTALLPYSLFLLLTHYVLYLQFYFHVSIKVSHGLMFLVFNPTIKTFSYLI